MALKEFCMSHVTLCTKFCNNEIIIETELIFSCSFLYVYSLEAKWEWAYVHLRPGVEREIFIKVVKLLWASYSASR